MSKQSESEAPEVPKEAIQGAQAQGRDRSWVEACVWNERMLAALGNGVKGGKRFGSIDKVYRPATLQVAWRKVAANAGAAGVDRMLLFAVIRAIEIIGEAASKISEETRASHGAIPWKAIIGMRNRLMHAYFEINTQTVWKTVTVEIPAALPNLRTLAAAP